jgi:DNA-binding response OmpR family regulator
MILLVDDEDLVRRMAACTLAHWGVSRLKGIKPDIPVLLSSGFSETEAALRFQSLGAGYLQKPYTVKHLAELVKAALNNQGETLGRVA